MPDFDLKQLRLQPGDVIVGHVPDHVDADQASEILADLKRAFAGCGHADVKIIMLSGGIRLEVEPVPVDQAQP